MRGQILRAWPRRRQVWGSGARARRLLRRLEEQEEEEEEEGRRRRDRAMVREGLGEGWMIYWAEGEEGGGLKKK